MSGIASFYDTKGKLYIDCSECNRGGNGKDHDKCSAGYSVRRPKKGGCFSGELMEPMKSELEKRTKVSA